MHGSGDGAYYEREGRAVLVCVCVPIRPVFYKSFKNETQVTLTVLSYDGTVDPDVIAMDASWQLSCRGGARLHQRLQ